MKMRIISDGFKWVVQREIFWIYWTMKTTEWRSSPNGGRWKLAVFDSLEKANEFVLSKSFSPPKFKVVSITTTT